MGSPNDFSIYLFISITGKILCNCELKQQFLFLYPKGLSLSVALIDTKQDSMKIWWCNQCESYHRRDQLASHVHTCQKNLHQDNHQYWISPYWDSKSIHITGSVSNTDRFSPKLLHENALDKTYILSKHWPQIKYKEVCAQRGRDFVHTNCHLCSHYLVCIENNLFIVGIGPILNK